MKKITIGIIAHVDSGKTTLSEALLYLSGSIRSFGRVDKGASFLDNDSMERERGITIYSKNARFSYSNTQFILIDTPGHADFSAEMERALSVLDYAVLLISAADGVRGRTQELWKLLAYYEVPVFVFFNKMDQPGADKDRLFRSFRASVSEEAVDFDLSGLLFTADAIESESTAIKTSAGTGTKAKGSMVSDASGNKETVSGEAGISDLYDSIAMCSEEAMEEYLETGSVSMETIRDMIADRMMFPCIFGSALKQNGVELMLKVMDACTIEPEYPQEFGARVYKILKAADGSRLTVMKITGGSLKNKSLLPDSRGMAADSVRIGSSVGDTENYSKINQIRLYNGLKFELCEEAFAGEVCAVTGLKESFAGQGFGIESDSVTPLMTPILSYTVLLPENADPVKAYQYFRDIEEENPELKAAWNEEQKEISVCVMGQVQTQILHSLLKERYGLAVGFGPGQVMYRETIAAPVIGAGHFEPLRHYAEAVLLMQPLPRGSGLVFDSAVRTERLALNWQRLILTHLEEKQHKGVLTGSYITDMRITVIAGKAHLKHTEGGDFRQAVYRAVRQGLMMAENVLLEPYYRFILEVPSQLVGRAMTDLDRMKASFGAPEPGTDDGISLLSGRAPVSRIGEYPAEVAAYTGGSGHIAFFNDGYDVCTDPQEVMLRKGYDPLSDMRNTPDSVFCAHGAGYIVPYDEVYGRLDISPDEFLDNIRTGTGNSQDDDHYNDIYGSVQLNQAFESAQNAGMKDTKDAEYDPFRKWQSIGTQEIDAIIAKVSRSNSKDKKQANRWKRKRAGWDASGRTVSRSAMSGDTMNPGHGSAKVFAIQDADYVVVDGYNVIFAWQELSDLARVNIDSARDALIDILSNFQSMTSAKVIAVFDAYRVKGHATERMTLQNVDLIFTGEEETADQYIEKFTNANGKKHNIVVVTSDGLEQIITRGQGCMLISSRDFRKHIDDLSSGLRERFGVK